jgi:putative FmdB family regulatory protein
MPIYEYRCSECGFQSEYLQKVSEPPMTVCPSCAKSTFQKLLSAAGFQLKGSGWYATDFKNGSAKPAESKSDAKSEAKSEAKAEGAPACGQGACPACTTN